MDAPRAKRRWYWPTPGWLVWGAAAATGVLFACDRWRWFPVNYQKGFPVLLAVAVVAAVLVLILMWMLVGLVFRRRVQFGLRTMLVFVTLCAVVCSWLAVRIKQARRQAEAIAAIQNKLGGLILHDWELLERTPWWYIPEPPAPEPLIRLLGIDFFADVEEMTLEDPRLTDAELSDLVALTNLKQLSLNGENVTDAGLSHLEGLTRLQQLVLVKANVSDDGVKKLQRALPNCRIYMCATWPTPP